MQFSENWKNVAQIFQAFFHQEKMTNSCMESIFLVMIVRGEKTVNFPLLLPYLRGNRDSLVLGKMVIFGPKSHVFQHLTNCPKLAVLSFIPWVAWVKNPSFIAPEKMSPKVSRKKQWVEESRVINGVFPQLSQHHIFRHRSSKLSLENYATKVTNMLLQQIVYLSPSLVVPPTVVA